MNMFFFFLNNNYAITGTEHVLIMRGSVIFQLISCQLVSVVAAILLFLSNYRCQLAE
jgi:hypothetical protein